MPPEAPAASIGVGFLGALGLVALGRALFGNGPVPRIGSAADVAAFLGFLVVIGVAFVALGLRRRK